MGNVSYFRYANGSAETTIIHWADVPTKTKHYLEDSYLPLRDDEAKTDSFPSTIAKLGKCFHERKFISYLTEEPLQMLLDITYHGCRKDDDNTKSNPRLYYEFEGFNQINSIEFYPGTRECVLGETRFKYRQPSDIEWDDHDAYEKYYEAKQEKIMEIINATEKELEKQSGENATKNHIEIDNVVWERCPFDDLIKSVRMTKDIMSLNRDDPLFKLYMSKVFAYMT